VADWSDRLNRYAQSVVAVLEHRGRVYGDPRLAFRDYARLFSTVLKTEVSPLDVALLQATLKLGRLSYDKRHPDSWLDLAGYALIGYLLLGPEDPDEETES